MPRGNTRASAGDEFMLVFAISIVVLVVISLFVSVSRLAVESSTSSAILSPESTTFSHEVHDHQVLSFSFSLMVYFANDKLLNWSFV